RGKERVGSYALPRLVERMAVGPLDPYPVLVSARDPQTPILAEGFECEEAGAGGALTVPSRFSEVERLGCHLSGSPEVLTRGREGGAQHEERVATFQLVVGIHHFLYLQTALQMPGGLAVSENGTRPLGRALAVLDGL